MHSHKAPPSPGVLVAAGRTCINSSHMHSIFSASALRVCLPYAKEQEEEEGRKWRKGGGRGGKTARAEEEEREEGEEEREDRKKEKVYEAGRGGKGRDRKEETTAETVIVRRKKG